MEFIIKDPNSLTAKILGGKDTVKVKTPQGLKEVKIVRKYDTTKEVKEIAKDNKKKKRWLW